MITIRNLMQNVEKGQSSLAVKYIFQQLNQLYDKNKDAIQIVFCSQDQNGTQIHLKIPSAERQGLYFDIVFWFATKDKLTQDTQLKVYSNSPSFAYNFAYLFNKSGALLFPEKYPSSFLTMPPKVRNPLKVHSFDKHLFMGLKKLIGKDLKNLSLNFQGNAAPAISTFKEKNP